MGFELICAYICIGLICFIGLSCALVQEIRESKGALLIELSLLSIAWPAFAITISVVMIMNLISEKRKK